MNKEQLKKNYENACNAYVKALLALWEVDTHYGYWIGNDVGGVYDIDGWITISMQDIVYCVENNVTSKEVCEWQDYCIKAHEYGFNLLNLNAWHKGAPRIPQATFDRLDGMKGSLNEEVDKIKRGEKE